MQAFAKLLGVILLASAIQLTLGADGNPQSGVFVSRAFTVVSSPSDIFVSRAFTVVSSPSDIFVSRAFTVVSSPSDIFVSRAFTVVNCAGSDDGLCGDCDDDGIPDQCELDCGADGGPCDVPGCGLSIDCNDNSVPDECDADCDGDMIPDECEIADCSPGDPDCDDCNGNGIPDECDIDSESSSDIVGPDALPDGIPDECQLDCNENFIPDDLDISEGTSPDCNGNGIPDECELSERCDGVACTDCDADCNDNCVIDSCDVDPTDPDDDGEVSDDCNSNGAPDECEIDPSNGAPGGPFFCDPQIETCDPDCNVNGIPDACDIADCAPDDPDCADCNVNGVPDKCDIASGFSQDDEPPPDGDGVPDECVVWNGESKENDQLWSTDDNWEGDDAPGDGDPNDLESVVIAAAGANVILDVDADNPNIDSLLLGSDTTLHVTGGDLSVVDPLGDLDGNILVRGDLLIGDGRAIDAEGEVTIGPGGVYQAEDPNDLLLDAILDAGSITVQGGGVVNVSGSMELNSEGQVTIGPGGVYQADPEAGGPVTATLEVGSMTVQGGTLEDGGGAVILSGSMGLITDGDLLLEELDDDGKDGCKGSGTPPDFNAGDNADVRVSGSLVTSRCGRVRHDSSLALLLGGDFDNLSINPDTSTGFNWDAGGLQMNGTSQTIEAAGEDRGPCPAGFNENFVIGALTLSAGSSTQVVDIFDNQQDGATACDEVLYVGVLSLEVGSELLTNGCRVYYEELINDGSIPGLGTDVLQAAPNCADMDGDGDVDAFDLANLLGSWGPCPPEDDCPADLDGDGIVDAFDLAILLGSWGTVP